MVSAGHLVTNLSRDTDSYKWVQIDRKEEREEKLTSPCFFFL